MMYVARLDVVSVPPGIGRLTTLRATSVDGLVKAIRLWEQQTTFFENLQSNYRVLWMGPQLPRDGVLG